MIAYGQCVMRYMKFITVTVSTSHCSIHTTEACTGVLIASLSVCSLLKYIAGLFLSAAIGKFTITQRQKGTDSVQGSHVAKQSMVQTSI